MESALNYNGLPRKVDVECGEGQKVKQGMFIGGRVDHRRHDTPQNCYYIICCCECCKPLPVKEGDKGRLFSPGDFERHAGLVKSNNWMATIKVRPVRSVPSITWTLGSYLRVMADWQCRQFPPGSQINVWNPHALLWQRGRVLRQFQTSNLNVPETQTYHDIYFPSNKRIETLILPAERVDNMIVDNIDFISSEAFAGARDHYFFGSGDMGVGYYFDLRGYYFDLLPQIIELHKNAIKTWETAAAPIPQKQAPSTTTNKTTKIKSMAPICEQKAPSFQHSPDRPLQDGQGQDAAARNLPQLQSNGAEPPPVLQSRSSPKQKKGEHATKPRQSPLHGPVKFLGIPTLNPLNKKTTVQGMTTSNAHDTTALTHRSDAPKNMEKNNLTYAGRTGKLHMSMKAAKKIEPAQVRTSEKVEKRCSVPNRIGRLCSEQPSPKASLPIAVSGSMKNQLNNAPGHADLVGTSAEDAPGEFKCETELKRRAWAKERLEAEAKPLPDKMTEVGVEMQGFPRCGSGKPMLGFGRMKRHAGGDSTALTRETKKAKRVDGEDSLPNHVHSGLGGGQRGSTLVASETPNVLNIVDNDENDRLRDENALLRRLLDCAIEMKLEIIDGTPNSIL